MTVEDVVVWVGFLGSWLLFLGPVYQAALDLSEESDLRRELGAARLRGNDHISAWWWLIPPVHFVLQRRQSREFRDRMINSLEPGQLERLVRYLNKATGWLYVGAGGLLIAVGETGELTLHYEWSAMVFGIVSAAMALFSVLNVAERMRRGRSILKSSKASTPSAEQRQTVDDP